jgi:hypothetical protein
MLHLKVLPTKTSPKAEKEERTRFVNISELTDQYRSFQLDDRNGMGRGRRRQTFQLYERGMGAGASVDVPWPAVGQD